MNAFERYILLALYAAQHRRAVAVEKAEASQVERDRSILLTAQVAANVFKQFGVRQSQRAFDAEHRSRRAMVVNLGDVGRHAQFLYSSNAGDTGLVA